MVYRILEMKTVTGEMVEYVRCVRREGRATIGMSMSIWRFTPEQVQSIRDTGKI